ncbi:MAG TPA: hypothetical protein VGO95_11770 [Modestobacter sp.]|nr:hypothetical protein [Modestobacter sp.]
MVIGLLPVEWLWHVLAVLTIGAVAGRTLGDRDPPLAAPAGAEHTHSTPPPPDDVAEGVRVAEQGTGIGEVHGVPGARAGERHLLVAVRSSR